MTHLKQPPHSIDAEISVLGAVMHKNGIIHDLDSMIETEDFYRKEHGLIYRRMWMMALSSQPVDILTLSEALDDAGELEEAGGLDYLGQIAETGYTAANCKSYARIIKDRAIERRLIAASNQIADQAFNGTDSVDQKIAEAQRVIFDIQGASEDEPVFINDCLKQAMQEIERRYMDKGDMHGLSTGFEVLDDVTGGFKPGQMILVAGRPGQGKTVLAMNIVENAVMQDKFVIVYNLEMSRDELTLRSMSSVGRIPFDKISKGRMDGHWDELTAGFSKFKDKSYYVDDNPRLTSAQIASRTRKIAARVGRNPDLIVIDYLQLLSDDNKHGPVERMTSISRNIKLTAKDLGCPIIAVSQLNRGVESRPNKRPGLADLRDSGALEQDADYVLMLYRDEYYNPDSAMQGVAELNVAKNRHGPTGTKAIASQLHMMRFDNLAKGYELPMQDKTPPKRGGFNYE